MTVSQVSTERSRLISRRQKERLQDLLAFLGGKLLFGIILLLAIIYLVFLGLGMARGNAFRPTLAVALGDTLYYLRQLARGELGTAFAAAYGQHHMAVAQILRETIPRSFGLLLVSLGLATLFGVLLGVLAAVKRYSRWRSWIVLFSVLGVSSPSFFLALVLQLGVLYLVRAMGKAWLPVGGFGWDSHLLLPALVLAARPVAQIARVTMVTLSDILREDYVRTARSKGLPASQIWARHIWRNAALPVLTTIVSSLRFSLSSLPIVEFYFGWPGIGATLLRAIARQDDHLTVALAVALGLFFILVSLFLEGSYFLIDPRLQEAQRRSRVGMSEGSIWETVRDEASGLWEVIRYLPGVRHLWPPQRQKTLPPLPPAGNVDAITLGSSLRSYRRRTWLRATVGNWPFLLGALLVLLLTVLYFWGASLAPYNPYTTHGLTIRGGKFSVPPFPPSAKYPLGSDVLGRDMLSLLLGGVRQTFTVVLFAVLARMLIGFLFGALAGWTAGSRFDRAIQGLADIVASLPALIFAMIMILALGIQQGIWVFVVGLSFVGWGEIVQYVRGEVMRLRGNLFMESARAVGNRLSGLVLHHILPNLLPSLLAMSALETGAVLMLLGELGFLDIFIGGGAFSEVYIGTFYHYSDIPEWGALLSNVRPFARSYPWTAFYPALAFFVAILAFNLFAEGLRTLIQEIGLDITRLFNRYTVTALVLLLLLVNWVQQNSGLAAFYQRQAKAFNAERALLDIKTLSSPEMEGRVIGSAGLDRAAAYIADQFKAEGLQPAGSHGGYFLTVKRDFFQLTDVPTLAVDGEPLVYRRDFVDAQTLVLNRGKCSGPLTVVGTGRLSSQKGRLGALPTVPALGKVQVPGGVVMLLHPLPPSAWVGAVHQGTLMVTDDPLLLQRRFVRSAYTHDIDKNQPVSGAPVFYISAAAADRILRQAGVTLASLQREEHRLGPDEVAMWRVPVNISGSIHGKIHRKVPVKHVLGYWPGESDQLDDQLLLLLTPYDGVGQDVQGNLIPGANDNASGVATMLELLRSWRETGYQPKKTMLFVAYVNEGVDYGQTPRRRPDVKTFLGAKFGFASSFHPEAALSWRGVGGGNGHAMVASVGGNLHLLQLLERTARSTGTSLHREDVPLDLGVIWSGKGGTGGEMPQASLYWEHYTALSHVPMDDWQHLDRKTLVSSGRVISLSLLVMGREVHY